MVKRYSPKLSYKLKEVPIKYIKVWNQAQARKLDREGVSELAKSIKHDGLLNPPMVQFISRTEYQLMSGQRRLSAMKRLRAKTMPVHVIPKRAMMSLEEAKAASVVENTHRNEMDQRDVVAAAKLLSDKIGKREAANHLGVTIATLYRYIGFDAVPEKLKDLVPSVATRDDMTKIFLAVPNIKRATIIAEKTQNLDTVIKKQYLKMLQKNPKTSHAKLLNMAKKTMVQQNVSMRLVKGAAKRLKVLSSRKNMSPNDYAKQILEKHLKK